MHRKPITPGERFGRLVAVERDPTSQGRARWICLCDCGNRKSVASNNLRSGQCPSCGCQKRELLQALRTTHNLSYKVPEYGIWSGMIQRCTNPKRAAYAAYGGRGITVCHQWLVFENFYADMGSRPTPNHQIERIDNDGPYSPENCRWASRVEQARNRQRSRRLTFQGETLSMAEWSDRLGIPYFRLRSRIQQGWPVERALTEP